MIVIVIPLVRFLAKVRMAESGCWEWTAARSMIRGEPCYGLFYLDGRQRLAHRVAYEWFVGPIPEGLEIDHLCGNKGCVNPSHLEAVTASENQRRGPLAQRTHCPKGHAYTTENTYLKYGRWKNCRACARDRWHRRAA